MIDILLVVHIIVAILLIAVILLQKSSTDGLGSLGGGSNTGFVTARTAARFLTRTTMFLAGLFIINSLVLANLSTKKHTSIIEKMEQEQQDNKSKDSLPVAK